MANMSSGVAAAFDRAASITLRETGSSAVTSNSVDSSINIPALTGAYWDNSALAPQSAAIHLFVSAIDAGNSDEEYKITFEVDEDAAFSTTSGPVNFTAGIQEDATGGPSYTDFTTELGDVAANDVALFPAGAAVDDAFYFGYDRPFSTININIGTVGTGTYTVAWEYYNGSTWESLSATDNTDSFKNSGANTVVFSAPIDWALTNIDGNSGYFVRAQRDAGTVTADPLATSAQADDVDGVVVVTMDVSRTTGVGFYVLPVDSSTIQKLKTNGGYMRSRVKVGGTSPSIEYNAYLTGPIF